MAHFGHHNQLSLKRQARAKRHLTAKQKGTQDGRCINQKIEEVGVWPSGEPKQRVIYLHVTKGLRSRLLSPMFNRVIV